MSLDLDFKKLPQADGRNGWYDILPPPKPATPVKGNSKADWIVLGAGFTGLAAARRLAELAPEATIALVDASRVGYGTAGRNSGFAIDLPHDITASSYTKSKEKDICAIRLNRSAIDYLRQAVTNCGIDCDWSEQGKIHGAIEARGIESLKQYAAGLDDLGEPSELLDAQQMQAKLGTSFYKAGLFTPGTVLVQPAALTRGLAENLPENVRLHENSPVNRIEKGENYRLVCAEGTVEAPRIILAINAYASFLKGLKGRVLPVYTYASMTRPLTPKEQAELGGDLSWGIIPSDPMGTTVRRLRNGRISVRNSFTYNRNLSVTDSQLEKVKRVHRRSFERRFPMLDGVEFEFTWGGPLCLSRNFGTVFGELEPGLYAGLCQNGLGITRGTASGKLIAEYALGHSSELLDILKTEPYPAANPPEPFLGMGVQASLFWKERQAGLER